ncbi:MAG: MATE family efflux transporter [Clostridia bacterium]|nr:MATE family efflux transporter [Clostridia bacterium]
MEHQSRSQQALAEAPLWPLMLKLAMPAVIAQLVNLLYNIVDRVYIGHMAENGDLALTGLGLTFPVLLSISAFSALVGSGGSPIAAIFLGKKDKASAQRILGNGVFLLLVFSAFLTVLFFAVKEPLLYLVGASEKTFAFADQYLSIYLLGTPFVLLSLGLNPYISCQGKSKVAMCSVLIGALCNIILDPIFIFALELGIRGAALATVVSQGISALWVVGFLISARSDLRLRPRDLRPRWDMIRRIAALGISPFIMQITESAISLVLNNGLQTYGGDLYVGSMTILNSVMQIIFALNNGFAGGVQSIISFNYGARNFERVKQTFRKLIGVTFTMGAVFTALVTLFPGFFAGLFTDNAQLIALTEKVLPVFCFGMFVFGIQTGCQNTFIGLGQAKISLCFALLRKVVLLIPLALILPRVGGLGVWGVYLSEPIADVLSATSIGITFLFSYKKILSEEAVQRV